MLIPRIGQCVLERETDFLRFGIELHDFDLHRIADFHDFGRMLDARVREFAVVDQTVDTAEIDECAEIRQAHDDAFANLTDFHRVEQLLFLGLQFFFQNVPLREHDAMPFVIEIDDFQTQMLPDEFFEIADRLPANLRCGNETTHAEIDEHAAFDDLRDGRFDHFVVVVRSDDFLPRFERARAPFGEKQRAVHLVDAMDHHFERVADFQRFGIDREREFAERQDAFGFTADVDEQFVFIFLNDEAVEYLAFVEDF